VKLDDTAPSIETARTIGTDRSIGGDKTVMVRAARQLLSAITKVLILADRVVIKQLVTAKDQVCLSTLLLHILCFSFTL